MLYLHITWGPLLICKLTSYVSAYAQDKWSLYFTIITLR